MEGAGYGTGGMRNEKRDRKCSGTVQIITFIYEIMILNKLWCLNY